MVICGRRRPTAPAERLCRGGRATWSGHCQRPCVPAARFRVDWAAAGEKFPEFAHVPHEELTALVAGARLVVRTGEARPYAHVLLRCGVFFRRGRQAPGVRITTPGLRSRPEPRMRQRPISNPRPRLLWDRRDVALPFWRCSKEHREAPLCPHRLWGTEGFWDEALLPRRRAVPA